MNTLNISVINARASAEGLSFAAVKAAIIECGDALRSHGWVAAPKELASMTSEDVIDAIYPRAFRIKQGEKYLFGELPHKHMLREEFLAKLNELPDGTLECEIEGEFYFSIKHVLVKKTGAEYSIKAVFDRFEWQFENSNQYFLPDGIRAAVATKIGVDVDSSTFHQAFDAIVDGTAVY